MSRRQTILDTIADLAANFIYYDRKEDEGLPRGEIEAAIKAGEITTTEIIESFSEHLRSSLPEEPRS